MITQVREWEGQQDSGVIITNGSGNWNHWRDEISDIAFVAPEYSDVTSENKQDRYSASSTGRTTNLANPSNVCRLLVKQAGREDALLPTLANC